MSQGTIVYCSRDDSAPPHFALCLAKLAQRHPDCELLHMVGNDIADMRNQAVLQTIGEWIWFIDTDMMFAPTTLERLLAHDVPVVQMLVLMRYPPHEPVLYQHSATQRNAAPAGPPRLVEVQSCGAGGTLYRKAVFEKITGPWFEGIIGREDTSFAQKIRAAGFPLHVDLATPAIHMTPVGVRPIYDGVNGEWRIGYVTSPGDGCELPFKMAVQPASSFGRHLELSR